MLLSRYIFVISKVSLTRIVAHITVHWKVTTWCLLSGKGQQQLQVNHLDILNQ